MEIEVHTIGMEAWRIKGGAGRGAKVMSLLISFLWDGLMEKIDCWGAKERIGIYMFQGFGPFRRGLWTISLLPRLTCNPMM